MLMQQRRQLKGLKQYRGWSALQEKAFWEGMEPKVNGQVEILVSS